MTAALDAWIAALDRLKELGERVAGSATDGGNAAAAVEHLVDQAVVWLAWSTFHADPSRPFFHRHNDLVSQWGGPNADNVYRHARLDPNRRYVVRGRMHGCDDFNLAIRAGFMHRPAWGTLAQVTANELGIRPGDEFEIRLGGDHPDAVPLPETAAMVSVREFYFEWREEEPAVFTIECLDPDPSSPVTEAEISDRLDEALAEITDSIAYWSDYMDDHRAKRTDNSFAATSVDVGKGLPVARYEFCFWSLGPDEAVVIELDEPDARYWSAQLYAMGTFEPLDLYAGITSRNNHQSTVSTDGRIHFVVAATDPGVPNWLDTGGRATGLCTIRWFWPYSDTRPSIRAEEVALTTVRSHLPADTASVGLTERAGELGRRQAHLRWRFRV